MRKAKTLKRGLALFLAALMVFSSPVPALATETGSGDPGISISVPGETEPDSSSIRNWRKGPLRPASGMR